MMSICLTWFPNCLVLGEPNIYQNLGDLARMWDFTWSCVWLWRISGSYSLEMMWVTIPWRLVF